MYLVGESKALLIKDNVSVITYIKTFIIKLEIYGVNQAPNYWLKDTRDVGLPPRPICLAC